MGFEKAGFIGTGNMGTALVGGIVENNWRPENIFIYDKLHDKQNKLAQKWKVKSTNSPRELAEEADFIVLCVKPDDVKTVLEGINSEVHQLISIAAGVELKLLRELLDGGEQLIRVMPNSPVQVGEGMSFLAPGKEVEKDFLEVARKIFSSVGKVEIVEEKKLNAVTALSGSGPAYVFYFLEALQEAGVYLGLDQESALEAACQTVQGGAELAATSEKDFYQLRQEVSSPGGTTVEALKHLEENGVKGKIIEAISQAKIKADKLMEE